MSSGTPLDFLTTALPGTEIRSAARLDLLLKKLPSAWKFWRSGGKEWAVFLALDEHFSKVDVEAIEKTKAIKIEPVVLATKYEGIKGISAHYKSLKPHLIYEVGGTPKLIAPPALPSMGPAVKKHPTSRVPIELLVALSTNRKIPDRHRAHLTNLAEKYLKKLKRRGGNDKVEQALLIDYARGVLDEMGLRADSIDAAAMVRTIEDGRLGSKRDHFFHSFQNYFLGVSILAEIPEAFAVSDKQTKLNWDIDPFNVWFLTVLWHDTGYSVQESKNYYKSAWGDADPAESANKKLKEHLERPVNIRGLRIISSLMTRLALVERPTTGWREPGEETKLSADALLVEKAMRRNMLGGSHGAAGALRLFADHDKDMDRLDEDKRNVLSQTVWVASCSIPFHDWYFRNDLRAESGKIHFPISRVPFAALLAFIDSIQDDWRDLDGIYPAIPSLLALKASAPGAVSVELDYRGIKDKELLWKVLEARDVLACLDQNKGLMKVKYPEWMGCK